MVRYESPTQALPRITTQDVTRHGITIPHGKEVLLVWGAANHDEREFEDPERFDIQREHTVPHMGFAFGSHLCLGMHLARMETRVLLEALFERLPGMRLDPEADDIHITGMVFRSPLSLPVVFEPGPVTRAGAS